MLKRTGKALLQLPYSIFLKTHKISDEDKVVIRLQLIIDSKLINANHFISIKSDKLPQPKYSTLIIMTSNRIPLNILRNSIDKSITLYGQPQKLKYSLIWLHGLGGEAENYVSFFSHGESTVHKGCRVKLIQAPKRYVTINNQQNTSWYDIRSLKRFTQPEQNVFNFTHIQQSHSVIQNHFNEQVNFWRQKDAASRLKPQKRVYVGGMSQGGVISLYYALSSTIVPAGAICFSGYALKSTPLINIDTLPTLIVHGNRDTTIREVDARNSYIKLLQKKDLAQYHTIKKLDHSVSLQQISMIRTWIDKINQRHMRIEQII